MFLLGVCHDEHLYIDRSFRQRRALRLPWLRRSGRGSMKHLLKNKTLMNSSMKIFSKIYLQCCFV